MDQRTRGNQKRDHDHWKKREWKKDIKEIKKIWKKKIELETRCFFLPLKIEERRQREAAHCKQKHVSVFSTNSKQKKKTISSLMSFYIFW